MTCRGRCAIRVSRGWPVQREACYVDYLDRYDDCYLDNYREEMLELAKHMRGGEGRGRGREKGREGGRRGEREGEREGEGLGEATTRHVLGMLDRVCRKNGERRNSVVCEEVRWGESAGSPGVRWATGVGANGGAGRGRERPHHAPSRDQRSRVQQHITRRFHSCIPCGSKASPHRVEDRTATLLR